MDTIEKIAVEKFVCRTDILRAINESSETEEIAILQEFDKECIDTFGDEYEKYDMPLVNEDDWLDYAEEILYDSFNIPNELQPYIDLDKFADDMKYDYSYVSLGKFTDFLGHA